MIRSAVIVEGYALDLLQDIATDFTYSIQDIREPETRRTDFSKTIEIPGTPRNNGLFAHIFNINVENDYDPGQPNIGYNYNPNKVAKATVMVDGIEVFRGVLRILKVVDDQGVLTYETNVTGRLADILYAFGDKKLSDIDFTDMDVSPTDPDAPNTLTVANIQQVWNNPDSYRYTYPLIDYGLSPDGVSFPISGFAPAIYVKEYVDRMFVDAGFTYESSFFNLPYFKSLIIPNTQKVEFTQSANSARFLECWSQWRIGNNGRVGKWREIFNIWGVPEFIDKYGFIHVGGTEDQSNKIIFTRDIETSVYFLFGYKVSTKDAIINVRLNGQQIWSERAGLPTLIDFNREIEIPKRQFRAGDILTLSMDLPPFNGVTMHAHTRVIMPSPNDTSSYPVDEGATLVMSDFVDKEVTQKDFFKSLILMHNLYVFTDPDNDRNLFIVPQAWFYSTFAGDAVDWTYKVDYSKPIEVIPMGELSSREFLFTYKKDSDYWNDDRYFKKYNEIYGQRSQVVDNDFVKDTKKIELIFSPTPSVQGANDRRVIPHIYKVDKSTNVKQRDTFNIRILQYGGLIPSYTNDGTTSAAYAPWKITNSSNVVLGTYIYYPFAGMMDSPVPEYVSRDLCFAPPREVFFDWLGGFPDVGLYRYYWESFINEITNKDSKLWRAYIYLTAKDINQLDFKNLVKIDNTYFKLNKVEQYNPLSEEVTRVELFKTAVQVEVVRPGFILHEDGGYLLHSDETPARIPYA